MKNVIKYSTLLLAFLPFVLQAQLIQNATVSRTQIFSGDTLVYTLKLSIPSSLESDKVAILNTAEWAKPFEIISEKLDTTAIEKENGFDILRTYTATLLGFDTTTTFIPPLGILNNSDTLFADSIAIQLRPMAIDTAQGIADITPPTEVSYGVLDWLKDHWEWPVGITLIAILAAFILWRISKQAKRTVEKEVIMVETPKLPAHIIALNALHKLKDEKVYAQTDLKNFYSQVSEIYRTYLEDRYRFSALEYSTTEILSELNLLIDDTVLKDDAKRILNLSDLIKYAKGLSSENEAIRSIDLTENFINKTKAITSTEQGENEKV